MAFFKITKQVGEEKSEEHPTSEQSIKEIDESAVRRPVPSGKQKKGTITISVSTATVQDIARFQITDPALFQSTIDIITSVLSQINDPQLEILGDCNCIWCQQKISEFKEALSS